VSTIVARRCIRLRLPSILSPTRRQLIDKLDPVAPNPLHVILLQVSRSPGNPRPDSIRIATCRAVHVGRVSTIPFLPTGADQPQPPIGTLWPRRRAKTATNFDYNNIFTYRPCGASYVTLLLCKNDDDKWSLDGFAIDSPISQQLYMYGFVEDLRLPPIEEIFQDLRWFTGNNSLRPGCLLPWPHSF
jgi:hypothetical protein